MSDNEYNYEPLDPRERRRRFGRSLGDILGETGPSPEGMDELFGGSRGVEQNNTGWIPVPSTRMTDIYYHNVDRAVCVRWVKTGRRGNLWVYRNVPPDVWGDFSEAASKGRFVNLGFTPPGGTPLYDHGPPTAWEESRYFNGLDK